MTDRESHPGNPYRQAKAHLAELKARYPRQFDSEHIGHSWPDGWHSIVSRVCERVDAKGVDVRWVQIKEKWAGLRMHFEGQVLRLDLRGPEGIHSYQESPQEIDLRPIQRLTGAAERLSLRTCGLCGRRGHEQDLGGWIFTACDPCMELIDRQRKLPWRSP